MITIFKTDVHDTKDEFHLLHNVLLRKYPGFKINFDLEDCDKILRIEGTNLSTQDVVGLLNSYGFFCKELD